MTYDHDYQDSIIFPYGIKNIEKPVKIDKNCWIGINVNICPGTIIENNSIIGMGSTVSKIIEENTIYGGNKTISTRDNKNYLYLLLHIRNICNPIRYLKFWHTMNHLRKNNDIRHISLMRSMFFTRMKII